MAAAPYSWPHLRLTTQMLSTVGITDIKIVVGDQANEKFARAQTRREITGKRCYSRVNLDMNQIAQLGVGDACVFLWYLVERERKDFLWAGSHAVSLTCRVDQLVFRKLHALSTRTSDCCRCHISRNLMRQRATFKLCLRLGLLF